MSHRLTAGMLDEPPLPVLTLEPLLTIVGTPIYLSFGKNRRQEKFDVPRALTRVDTEIDYAPKPPNSPVFPKPQDIPSGAEIVMKHDHILGKTSRFPTSQWQAALRRAIAGFVWLLTGSLGDFNGDRHRRQISLNQLSMTRFSGAWKKNVWQPSDRLRNTALIRFCSAS